MKKLFRALRSVFKACFEFCELAVLRGRREGFEGCFLRGHLTPRTITEATVVFLLLMSPSHQVRRVCLALCVVLYAAWFCQNQFGTYPVRALCVDGGSSVVVARAAVCISC